MGTTLCGLQGLLNFSIIARIFIRRSLPESCSFQQNELLVSFSELRSFLRRIVSVKNANLGITNLPEFATFFTVCTSTFQLLIEVSWSNKTKRETGNLACKAITVLASSGPESSRRLRPPNFKTIGTWRWQGCQPYAPAAFTRRKYSWYSFFADPRAIVCQWKFPTIPTRIEPATFLLVAQWTTGNITHVLFVERKIKLSELHFWSDITDR